MAWAKLVVVGLAVLATAALVASCSQGTSSDAEHEGNGEPVGSGESVVMYSSPTCGCCSEYAAYLRSRGFVVDVRHVDDLDEIKTRFGVPDQAEACHTAIMGDYIVEGHVPVEAVDQLLGERPAIDGIALPGMPAGSPGMGGVQEEPFEILSIDGGSLTPYVTL